VLARRAIQPCGLCIHIKRSAEPQRQHCIPANLPSAAAAAAAVAAAPADPAPAAGTAAAAAPPCPACPMGLPPTALAAAAVATLKAVGPEAAAAALLAAAPPDQVRSKSVHRAGWLRVCREGGQQSLPLCAMWQSTLSVHRSTQNAVTTRQAPVTDAVASHCASATACTFPGYDKWWLHLRTLIAWDNVVGEGRDHIGIGLGSELGLG